MGRYDALTKLEEPKKVTTPSPAVSSPTPQSNVKNLTPPTQKGPTIEPKIQQYERANAQANKYPNGKRIITRNSFEIYEDQMDSLRRRSYEEKMNGKLGS